MDVRPSLTFWLVVAIFGIVAFYICMPKIGHGNARPMAAAADIRGGIKIAFDQFRMDTGAYPKGTNGLAELLRPAAGTTNWHGPYLDQIAADPWGNRYYYECPGIHNRDAYDLFSSGPDGRVGTEDDINNWR